MESLADLVVRAQKGDVAAFGSVVRATQLMAFAVVLPNRTVKIAPTEYPMCRQAWELAVEDDGQWVEVLAWGVFTDKIVHHVGGDPRKHVARRCWCGLERLAMLRYHIDDARKIEAAKVA